jgi:hypothetical protein
LASGHQKKIFRFAFNLGTKQHNNETVDNLADANARELFEFPISSQTENFKFGTLGQIMNLGDESVVLKFLKEEGRKKCHLC